MYFGLFDEVELDPKPFGEITNIEQWYFNRLKEIEKEKEYVMKNECPCHHGLKGYDGEDGIDDSRCYDINGDSKSCLRCWNEVIK